MRYFTEYLLKSSVGNSPIDLLVSCAGIYLGSGQDANTFDFNEWHTSFQVNTIAPIRLAGLLLENLKLGSEKKVAFLTSRMGSIADNTSGGSYLYRSSKAALNMAVKSLSFEFESAGVATVLLHPGWVKTDMGGKNGLLTPEESVKKMVAIINDLSIKESGKFISHDKSIIPW